MVKLVVPSSLWATSRFSHSKRLGLGAAMATEKLKDRARRPHRNSNAAALAVAFGPWNDQKRTFTKIADFRSTISWSLDNVMVKVFSILRPTLKWWHVVAVTIWVRRVVGRSSSAASSGTWRTMSRSAVQFLQWVVAVLDGIVHIC